VAIVSVGFKLHRLQWPILDSHGVCDLIAWLSGNLVHAVLVKAPMLLSPITVQVLLARPSRSRATSQPPARSSRLPRRCNADACRAAPWRRGRCSRRTTRKGSRRRGGVGRVRRRQTGTRLSRSGRVRSTHADTSWHRRWFCRSGRRARSSARRPWRQTCSALCEALSCSSAAQMVHTSALMRPHRHGGSWNRKRSCHPAPTAPPMERRTLGDRLGASAVPSAQPRD